MSKEKLDMVEELAAVKESGRLRGNNHAPCADVVGQLVDLVLVQNVELELLKAKANKPAPARKAPAKKKTVKSVKPSAAS